MNKCRIAEPNSSRRMIRKAGTALAATLLFANAAYAEADHGSGRPLPKAQKERRAAARNQGASASRTAASVWRGISICRPASTRKNMLPSSPFILAAALRNRRPACMRRNSPSRDLSRWLSTRHIRARAAASPGSRRSDEAGRRHLQRRRLLTTLPYVILVASARWKSALEVATRLRQPRRNAGSKRSPQ